MVGLGLERFPIYICMKTFGSKDTGEKLPLYVCIPLLCWSQAFGSKCHRFTILNQSCSQCFLRSVNLDRGFGVWVEVDHMCGSLDALFDITYPEDTIFDEIRNRRYELGADLVILMRPHAGDGSCGISWGNGTDQPDGTISGSRRYMYSHIAIECPDSVTASLNV